MNSNRHEIPDQNLDAYKLSYLIEVGLREFIIDKLSAKFGHKWWRQRIPDDVQRRMMDGRRYERSIPWTKLVPHHPLYYVDFPDLRKIMERNDNWREVFQQVFKSKPALEGTLIDVEPTRNKVAHHRKVTSDEVKRLASSYNKVATAIGSDLFNSYVQNCTNAYDVGEVLERLTQEAEGVFRAFNDYLPSPGLPVWAETRNSWWFDGEYLGHETDAITSFFRTAEDYAGLPRSRGSGHKVEAWIKTQSIDSKHRDALRALRTLLTQ